MLSRRVGPQTYPVFEAAKQVDIYGYSGGSNFEEHTTAPLAALVPDGCDTVRRSRQAFLVRGNACWRSLGLGRPKDE